MNTVSLIGRMTSDAVVRYRGDLAVASFNLAIDRPPRPDGTKETDFPRITAYGKTAEFCEKYLKKGNRAAILGRIKTDSYEKDGQTHHVTDIIASRVEIIDWPAKKDEEEDFFF